MSRRESVGRLRSASQPASGPPTLRMVSCAVLPPRLPRGLAPPTGIVVLGAGHFDEVPNWQQDLPDQEAPVSRRRSLFRKAGLTTQRHRVDPNDELPPFVMRQIPYDTWRKHYAKDKDGNYKGTHTPAEDCLLKPEDVQKWRLGDPVTRADRWTRGREALPVYEEAHAEGAAPDYDTEHDGLPTPAHGEGLLTPEEGRLVEYFDVTAARPQPQQSQSVQTPLTIPPSYIGDAGPSSSDTSAPRPRPQTIADGRTAEEIIADSQARGKPKMTWKQRLSKGFQQTTATGTG